MIFMTTLSSVAVLLLYAVPGFLLSKTKLVSNSAIPAFAKVLLYVCQPCLTFYSFDKADFSSELLLNLVLFFVISLVFQLGFLLIFFFLFIKKSKGDIRYRIFNIALVLSNCGFFGIPVVEKLFPERSDAAVYCLVFTLAMNLLCWSLVLYIITLDRRYIKPQRLILNPATISFIVAFVLFVFSIKLPAMLGEAVSLGGKISTPLCMTILGLRLANVKPARLLLTPVQYALVIFKQMLIPLCVFALLYFIPMDSFIKQLIFILFCCPVASNVLNFAEIAGEGQETASCCVLLGTVTSIITMPVMMFLLA